MSGLNPASSSPRVALVVDDSASMRKLVSQTLRSVGYEICEAGNGIEALVQVTVAPRIDLVIADVNMPVMDGIKLVGQLRKNPNMLIVPILMLTTVTESRDKERAKLAGANGWMTKPFAPEQLIATIQKVVGR